MALDPETRSDVQASLFLVMHSTPLPERGEAVARQVFALADAKGIEVDDVIEALLPLLPPSPNYPMPQSRKNERF